MKGVIHNIQKFRKIKSSEGYEIKTRNLLRAYCFWSKRKDLKDVLIITHCSLKQKSLSAVKKIIADRIKEINQDLCVIDIKGD